MIRVSGPNSEIEVEARKKLLNEKELKQILSSTATTQTLRSTKIKLVDLLGFYDRIIGSIAASLTNLRKKPINTVKDQILRQEKDMSAAKVEKSKFRRYMVKLDELLAHHEKQK